MDIWLEHGVPETGELLTKSILLSYEGKILRFNLSPSSKGGWIPGDNPIKLKSAILTLKSIIMDNRLSELVNIWTSPPI